VEKQKILDRLRYLEDLAVQLDVGIRKLRDDLDYDFDDVVDSDS
jgi:hypothetical protein